MRSAKTILPQDAAFLSAFRGYLEYASRAPDASPSLRWDWTVKPSRVGAAKDDSEVTVVLPRAGEPIARAVADQGPNARAIPASGKRPRKGSACAPKG